METKKIKITLIDEMLGMTPSSKEIHAEYIASKAPDAMSTAEEVEAMGVDEVIKKAQTIFPRDEDGNAFLWDYQIKGLMKDVCGMLSRGKGTKSNGLKAYKKIIDGLIFVMERKIPIVLPDGGEFGNCQRSMRASTAQGERITLANSETVPEGSTMVLTIGYYPLAKGKGNIWECIQEWLDYGRLRGLCQWRNSGKGRYTWELCK